jgi:hypothetical protein
MLGEFLPQVTGCRLLLGFGVGWVSGLVCRVLSCVSASALYSVLPA